MIATTLLLKIAY